MPRMVKSWRITLRRSGLIPQGDWQRLGRGFPLPNSRMGLSPMEESDHRTVMIGYDYVMSYEHEDVTMRPP